MGPAVGFGPADENKRMVNASLNHMKKINPYPFTITKRRTI